MNAQKPRKSLGQFIKDFPAMLGLGALVTTYVGGAIFAAVVFGAIAFVVIVAAIFLGGFWFWSFVAVCAGVGYWIWQQDDPELPAPRALGRPAGDFGDGGFAMSGELAAQDVLCHDGDPGRRSRGIYLQCFIGAYGGERDLAIFPWRDEQGTAFHAPYCLTYRGDAHGVTIAPTRSGKGTGAIIPTLLMTDDSLFVLDVKGENWFVTHKNLEQRGFNVVLLNPFNRWGKELGYEPPLTRQFNPLANLKPDQQGFVDAVRGMASALIIEQGKEPHFTNRARDLVACLIAHVCSDETELKHGRNHLPRVRQILGMEINLFAAYMMAATQSRVPIVRNNAGSFAPARPEDAREMQGILSTALGQLGWLDDEQIIYFLEGNSFATDDLVTGARRGDFSFTNLRQPKTAVFFIIGAEQLQTYQGFVRLMVQSCFNALWKTPAAGDAPVVMVLDEIYQLGQLEILKRAAGLLAGYRVRMWSIFQDLGQLKEVYGDAWETVLANAGFIQLLGVNDLTTAEYFSRKIGKSTLMLESFSGGSSSNSSAGSGSHSYSSGSSSSWSVSPHAVDACPPQMLLQLARNPLDPRGLVFFKNEAHPALTTNVPYFADFFHLPPPDWSPVNVLPNAARAEDFEAGIAAARAYVIERQAQRAEIDRADFYAGRKTPAKANGTRPPANDNEREATISCVHQGCGQALSVPMDQGAIRVTCTSCGGLFDFNPDALRQARAAAMSRPANA